MVSVLMCVFYFLGRRGMSSIKSLKDRDATFWTVSLLSKKTIHNYPIRNIQEAKLHSDITVDTTNASDTTYIHTTGVKNISPCNIHHVGGFKPFEQYACQNGFIFPK